MAHIKAPNSLGFPKFLGKGMFGFRTIYIRLRFKRHGLHARFVGLMWLLALRPFPECWERTVSLTVNTIAAFDIRKRDGTCRSGPPKVYKTMALFTLLWVGAGF